MRSQCWRSWLLLVTLSVIDLFGDEARAQSKITRAAFEEHSPLTRILPGGLESYLASGLSRSMVFASGEGAMERTHV